jgi:N-methylhydantoinase A
VARELQIRKLIIPPSPGILCAFGQLVADLRHDLIETHIFPYTPDNAVRALAIASRLSDAAAQLLAADRVAVDKRAISVHVEARYIGQSYELPIAFDCRDSAAWPRLADAFHTAHRQRFGHSDADAPIEIVGFGATAIGKVDTPELPTLAAGVATPPAEARLTARSIFLEGTAADGAGAWRQASVFERNKLLANNEIAGPAVIEELSATTILYPGDRAQVHASGALLVECAP